MVGLPNSCHDDAKEVGGDDEGEGCEPELHEHAGEDCETSDEARETVDRGKKFCWKPFLVQQDSHNAECESEEANGDAHPQQESRLDVKNEVLVGGLVTGRDDSDKRRMK